MEKSFTFAFNKTASLLNKLILSVFAVFFLFSTYGIVSGSIEGSPHDLSTKQCTICHGDKSERGENPLWDGQQVFKTFTLYNAPNPDMKSNQQDSSPSSLCLSCHNGIFSKFIKNRGPSASDMDYDYDESLYYFYSIENNPGNDHPVGFAYKPMNDVDNNNFPRAVVMPGKPHNKAIQGKTTGTYYPLYGSDQNQFECTTCHVAHYPADQSVKGKNYNHLLRADNNQSSMCRDCHQNKYSGDMYNAFR